LEIYKDFLKHTNFECKIDNKLGKYPVSAQSAGPPSRGPPAAAERRRRARASAVDLVRERRVVVKEKQVLAEFGDEDAAAGTAAGGHCPRASSWRRWSGLFQFNFYSKKKFFFELI
jgi:hypothetical protein